MSDQAQTLSSNRAARQQGPTQPKMDRIQALAILKEANALENATPYQEKALVKALREGKINERDLTTAVRARSTTLDTADTTSAADILLGAAKSGINVPVIARLADVATNGGVDKFNGNSLRHLAKLVPNVTARPGENKDAAVDRFKSLSPKQQDQAAQNLGTLVHIAEEVGITYNLAVEVFRREGSVDATQMTLRAIHDKIAGEKYEGSSGNGVGEAVCKQVYRYIRLIDAGKTIEAARLLDSAE